MMGVKITVEKKVLEGIQAELTWISMPVAQYHSEMGTFLQQIINGQRKRAKKIKRVLAVILQQSFFNEVD